MPAKSPRSLLFRGKCFSTKVKTKEATTNEFTSITDRDVSWRFKQNIVTVRPLLSGHPRDFEINWIGMAVNMILLTLYSKMLLKSERI